MKEQLLRAKQSLEAEPVAKYLSDKCRVSSVEEKEASGEALDTRHSTPVLISEGQSFPVEVRYLSQPDERPVTEQAADIIEAERLPPERGQDVVGGAPQVGRGIDERPVEIEDNRPHRHDSA